MFMQIKRVIKPRTKKQIVFEVAAILLLVLILGVLLLQIFPGLKRLLPCIGCDPNVYVASSISTVSLTDSYIYTINALTGRVQQTTDLGFVGNIYYQKVMNGICYLLVDFNTVAVPTYATELLAVRLSDGKVLWDFYATDIDSNIIATSTMLYLPLSSKQAGVVAIHISNGHVAWRYIFPQSGVTSSFYQAPLLFDSGDSIIAVSQDGSHRLVALRSATGKRVWNRTLDAVGDLISPILDENHLFLSVSPEAYDGTITTEQSMANIFEFDLNSGKQLWRGKLAAKEQVRALHRVSNYLLIETASNSVYALQEPSMTLAWSYTPSIAGQPGQAEWFYTDTTVYGILYIIDPHTFALKQVLCAWQLPHKQPLFQINLGLHDHRTFSFLQGYIIAFSSTNTSAGLSPTKPDNDVEVLQAQTGAVLWHKKIGSIPPGGVDLSWDLTLLSSNTGQDEPTYYIPDNSVQSQVTLFFLNSQITYQYAHTNILYALDLQSGLDLWQVNLEWLNSNPSFHPTPTPTPPIVINYPSPTSSHDFTNFVGTWVSHTGGIIISKNGKAMTSFTCLYEVDCQKEGDNASYQFTKVSGNTAYGTVISTNYQSSADGLTPGASVTLQLKKNGTLDLLTRAPADFRFCDMRASGDGLCGA